MDCAHPFSPHITANATNITAVGTTECASPMSPIRALAAAETMSPVVAVVGDESVDELADGIGEEECRSDDSQLRCVQRPAVENGLLHDVETGAADVVETVSERCGDECLQAQTSVVLVARRLVLLPGRGRRADAVEFRNTAHGVSRAVRASGGRRSAVRAGRSGSAWRPCRPVFRTPRPGRPLLRHRRKARRSGRATGSSPTVSSRRR